MIILMIVGVINPSGVDPSTPVPFFIKCIKLFSPIAHAIEALAVSEFSGMQFEKPKSRLFGFRRIREFTRMGGLACKYSTCDLVARTEVVNSNRWLTLYFMTLKMLTAYGGPSGKEWG